MERKSVVLRLGSTASVAGSMVVLKLDPPHGTHEGKGLRVWTYAYIGVVPTGCNHAWVTRVREATGGHRTWDFWSTVKCFNHLATVSLQALVKHLGATRHSKAIYSN